MLPIKRTSTPKKAPAMGVPKTEAKPALIPHIINLRLSFELKRNTVANMDESPAPIWAAGPSLPAEPPAARVMTVAINLTGTVRGFILPAYLWIDSMTFSVPCPLASGERYFISSAEKIAQRGVVRNSTHAEK